MSYLVLARKWRPKGFDDLVGQEPIMRILKNAIDQGKIAHAYIFSGPRGVGKTSSARILAKALNCKEGPTPVPCGVCESCTAIADGSSVDVTEIDGASNNSVDDVRDLRERVKYAPSGGKYKVYIIDEVHMLSGSAFNALLKTLEEPPSHVIFVLATTEMKKIPATVLSRCQHMPFRRISSAVIRARLTQIAETEGIRAAPSALSLVARAADGSMRDSLTILDQLSSFSSEITEEDAMSLLGIADLGMLTRVSKALIGGDRVGLLEAVNLLAEQGADMRSFARELVQFFRDLLVARVVKRPEEILDLSSEEMAAVREIVAATSDDQLTLMLSEIIKAETDIRNASSPRLALEMALIRASFLSSIKPLKEVIENIERYGKLSGGTLPHPLPERAEKRTGDISDADIPVKEERPEGPFATPAHVVPRQDEQMESAAAGGEKDIAAVWKKTITRIEQPTLSSVLQQSGIELKGNEILLTLDGGQALIFEDSVKKNIKKLEKIVSEEAGMEIRIRLATVNKKRVPARELKETVREDPLIREALELFEGRIVDVTPAGNPENIDNGGEDV